MTGGAATDVTVAAARPEDTHAVAARLGRSLEAVLARGEAPTVLVGLVGVMGAGKTAFVRGLVEALPGGSAAEVSSPTYAIAQPYPTEPPVLHVDLFRLDSVEEFDAIDGPLLVASEGIVLVEWADRLLGFGGLEPGSNGPAGPRTEPWLSLDRWVEVRLSIPADGTRAIRILAHGAEAARWLEGAFRT